MQVTMMIYVHICMRTFTLSSENIRHIMHYVWVINNCLFLLIKKYHCILFSYIFTVICNDLLQIIRQLFDNSWKKFRGFRCDKVFDEFLNMVFVRESFLHKSNRRIVYCKISLFRRVKWIQFFFLHFSYCMRSGVVMVNNIFSFNHSERCHSLANTHVC